jgi:hypothetical protein
MPDEIATGSAGAPDARRHSEGDRGEQSPLQTRAQFLKNWSWELVISFNQGACSRGSAQHGFNRETQEETAREWSEKQQQVLSFEQTIEFLRSCHRKAPFLFFNGNTFADIGRQLSAAAFADLPQSRRREVTSAIAHNIAGVLDREAMVAIVESLCETADWKAGDRIKTMRGATHGLIVKILDDGRVVWKPDGSESELIGLPESLIREKFR